jgi:hypothetical protein
VVVADTRLGAASYGRGLRIVCGIPSGVNAAQAPLFLSNTAIAPLFCWKMW